MEAYPQRQCWLRGLNKNVLLISLFVKKHQTHASFSFHLLIMSHIVLVCHQNPNKIQQNIVTALSHNLKKFNILFIFYYNIYSSYLQGSAIYSSCWVCVIADWSYYFCMYLLIIINHTSGGVSQMSGVNCLSLGEQMSLHTWFYTWTHFSAAINSKERDS